MYEGTWGMLEVQAGVSERREAGVKTTAAHDASGCWEMMEDPVGAGRSSGGGEMRVLVHSLLGVSSPFDRYLRTHD
jgi:hypothetical protein